MNQRTSIFGLLFDSLTRREALSKISQLIKKGKEKNRSHYVATVNLDFMHQTFHTFSHSIKHPELHRCLTEADMVVADGMPLVWWSKWMESPLPERVTGADLLPDLCLLAARQNLRVFFLGANPKVLKKANQNLLKKIPDLNIVGNASPMVATEGNALHSIHKDDAEVIEEIKNKKPDILFLCLGCPKQELFYHRLKESTHVPLVIGLGGSPNFTANNIKRAPVILQKLGLEWVHRLSQEPTRLFKRYFNNGLFFLWNTPKVIFNHNHTRSKVQHWSNYSILKNNHYQTVWVAPSKLKRLPKQHHKNQFLILDMVNVDHIDPHILALLAEKVAHHGLQIIGLTKKLRQYLCSSHEIHFLNASIDNQYIERNNKAHVAISRSDTDMLCHLFGHLNFSFHKYFFNKFKNLPKYINEVHISFRFAQSIDHEFMATLLALQVKLKKLNVDLVLVELNKEHRSSLKSMKLSSAFKQLNRPLDLKYRVDEQLLSESSPIKIIA